jgi:hypothetical protein
VEVFNQVLEPVIQHLKEHRAKVVAIVTDNAANCVAAAKLAHDVYATSHVRCFAHCLQLAIGRAMEHMPNVQQALTEAKGIAGWPAPCATRWWSQLQSLQVMAKRELPLVEPQLSLVKGHLQQAIHELLPFRAIGRILEAEDTSLPLALKLWLNLESTTQGLPKLFLRDRLFRMHSELFLAVAVLSPHFDVNKMPPGTSTWIVDQLVPLFRTILTASGENEKHGPGIKQKLEAWLTREDCRKPKIEAHKRGDFHSFWSTVEMFERYRSLRIIATAINAMWASEAACERMFSHQALAHTRIRNRMTAELVDAEVLVRCRPDKRERDDEEDDDHVLDEIEVPASYNTTIASDLLTEDEAELVVWIATLKHRWSVSQRVTLNLGTTVQKCDVDKLDDTHADNPNGWLGLRAKRSANITTCLFLAEEDPKRPRWTRCFS